MPFPTSQDAITMLERGRADQAVALLRRMIQHTPHHVTAHVLLARAYEASGDLPGAHAAWQHARLLMPGSPVIEAGVRRTRTSKATADSPPQRHTSEAASSSRRPSSRLASLEADLARRNRSEAERPEAERPEAERPEAERPEAGRPREPRRPRPASSSPSASASSAATGDYDDLDSLIQDLEGAQRITPHPDAGDVPAPELDDDLDDMVSETLARIYAAQGQHSESARVYHRLAAQQPQRADELVAKAREQEKLAAEADE